MSAKLTKEDKSKIEETMHSIIEDVFRLYDISNTKTINIRTNDYLKISDSCILKISKNDIKLVTYYTSYETFDFMTLGPGLLKKDKTYKLGTRRFNKTITSGLDYDVAIEFIKSYKGIREELKSVSTKLSAKKDETMESITEWYNRFQKEATIEFDLPKTNNQHAIVVTNENGKTVGTIDFGDKIIKIVTSGDIRFVDKREDKEKEVKTKKK